MQLLAHGPCPPRHLVVVEVLLVQVHHNLHIFLRQLFTVDLRVLLCGKILVSLIHELLRVLIHKVDGRRLVHPACIVICSAMLPAGGLVLRRASPRVVTLQRQCRLVVLSVADQTPCTVF